MFNAKTVKLTAFIMGAAIAALYAVPASAKPPMEDVFGLPAMTQPRISPDGTHVAMLQPVNGRLSLLVYKLGSKDAPRGTAAGDVDIQGFFWENNTRLVLIAAFPSRRRGAGYDIKFRETRLVATDLDGGNAVVLFRDQQDGDRAVGYQTQIISRLPDDEEHILVGMDLSRSGFWTANKVNVNTGAAISVARGGVDTVDYVADADGNVRIRIDFDDNKFTFFHRPASGGDWKKIYSYERFRDTDFDPLGFSEDGKTFYVSSNHEGRGGLYTMDLASGALTRVFLHPKVDIDGTTTGLRTTAVSGYSYTVDLPEFVFFEESARERHEIVNEALGTPVAFVSSSSKDETKHIVAALGPTLPPTYYFFDETKKSMSEIGSQYPKVGPENAADVRPFPYKARDGQMIDAYLAIPRGAGPGPYPTVIMPHGGPQARDTMEYDSLLQAIATRGYAVLQPNFRGSTGYGKDFENGGYKQWGLRMQDDVTDGTNALIAAGIADPKRTCIMGWSYGAYAAAMGVVKEPGLYKCAVAINGVYDLIELQRDLRNDRARGALDFWTNTMGDATGSDADYLAKSSPAKRAGEIRVPVFLVHDKDDRQAPFEEGIRMRDALRRANVAHEWYEYENGDHSMLYGPSRIDMMKKIEAFLAANL